MDSYIALAKEAVENFIKNRKIIKDIPAEFKTKKAGVFVCLKKNNELRGCIGTYLPTKENIGEEIIHNAIAAALEDNRFLPVQEEELGQLKFGVDILGLPEKISSLQDLDCKKYGIIVKTIDGRCGLLLPDLEGVETVEQQVTIACNKGGVDPRSDHLIIYRFTVERHE